MAFQKYALKGYNSASEWQGEIALTSVSKFVSHMIPTSSDATSFLNIADYGSSEGLNSMLFFLSALKLFRESNPTPVHITHADLE